MSRPSVMSMSEVEVLSVQRRRRYSAEEKQRMVQETYQPGMSLGVHPGPVIAELDKGNQEDMTLALISSRPHRVEGDSE